MLCNHFKMKTNKIENEIENDKISANIAGNFWKLTIVASLNIIKSFIIYSIGKSFNLI